MGRTGTGRKHTLLVKYAEAGDCYVTWRWVDDAGPADFAGVAQIDADTIAVAQSTMAQAVPDPLPGESIADGVDRAVRTGPLSTPTSTAQLTAALGTALIPADLVDELRSAPTRPALRIQPSPSLTRMPWESLRVGDSVLDDLADVVGAAPATVISHSAAVDAGDPSGPLVAIIDPRIPGQSASSALGSVLGRPSVDSPLSALLDHPVRPAAAHYSDLARRTDIDRIWLRDNLVNAGRLLYVGHVSAAVGPDADSVVAALHLCCTDAQGTHLPLTASDLLTTGFRFPPRAALIGCNSGGDLAHPDGMGLTMATLALGAQVVTATRWAVPTNRALARAGDLGDRAPLEELVLAVDAAHRSSAPLDALAAWQRGARARWYAHGHPADSPLLWSALTTTVR